VRVRIRRARAMMSSSHFPAGPMIFRVWRFRRKSVSGLPGVGLFLVSCFFSFAGSCLVGVQL